MTVINEDVVTRAFIDLVKSAVGTSLAEVGLTGAKTPAVIKTRIGKQAPDYPYFVVSIVDRTNLTAHGTGSFVSDNDLTSYDRIEGFLYSFRCYGKDSINIVNYLHQYLDIPSVLEAVRADTGGAIKIVNNPTPLPLVVGGDYIESSYFTFLWASHNAIEDPNSSLIETITITYN